MRAPDVVTLGEALVVVRPTDTSPVVSASSFVLSAVGAEFNVAVALARLGHLVTFVGRIGDDAAGLRIRRALQAEGVDTARLRTDGAAPTGLLVRDLGGRRGTAVDYHRTGSAGARLCPDDVDDDAIAAARYLHVTGLTCGLSPEAAAAVGSAARTAVEAGTPVVLDPNLRFRLQPASVWPELLAPLLPLAHLVVGSPAELQLVAGAVDVQDTINRLMDVGVRTVVLRCGTGPTRVVDRATALDLEVPVDAVEPVDPVGAGDAFTGGLLSGLLDGQSLSDAVVRAHAVARRCVLAPGDTDGLPSRRELDDDGEVRR